MQVFYTVDSLQNALLSERQAGKNIGFVPTMGALHQGHLNLVNKAQKQNDIVVVSIFVNPTQFSNSSDLENYPRLPEADVLLLEKAQVTYAFLPTEAEVYPVKTTTEHFNFNGLDTKMEGAHRPGHFDAVATVVKRLFDIVKPQKAYFGEKDYQQLLIIKSLVKQLILPIDIIAVPTLRSKNGLALSSRNERLSENQKKEALIIVQTMIWAQQQYNLQPFATILSEIEKRFSLSGLELQYAQIVGAESLTTLEPHLEKEPARIFIAAFAGEVRLIDNLSLN